MRGQVFHETLSNLAEQYGDVFSIQLGTQLTIVLSSRDVIHQAYVKMSRQFSNRPDLPSFIISARGLQGIFFANLGDQYKHNKAMNHRAMQKLFLNKSYMDLLLNIEVEKMITLFDNHMFEKRAFCPMSEFGYIVPSVMMSFMFGENHSYESPELLSYIECTQKAIENIKTHKDFLNYKILQVLPNELSVVEKCTKINDDMILKKLKSFQTCDVKNPCLLSLYFENYHRDLREEPLTNVEILELGRTCSDMLAAGFETTTASLSWAVMYLIKYPQVLELCRKEIREVTGKDPLSVEHETSLPYFVATIHDILRLSSVAPLVLRATPEDVQFRSFIIPKNTLILSNVYKCNHNELEWKKPNELYPEHFLDDEGKLDANAIRKLSSFSTGIRRCPGEKFAIHEIFFLLGTLIRTYKMILTQPPLDELPKDGLILTPKYYAIKLERY